MKDPKKQLLHRFHLHVVSKHPLPVVTVIRGRGQKSQQHLIAESNALIAALRQVCREDWKAIRRKTVEGVIENAHCSVAGYSNRRDGGFYLTCHEVFRSYSHAASSVVLDSADGEAIVASAGITIAINVVDIPVIWINSRVVDTAKESVDRAELGSWLCAIGIGHDDPTGHTVQGPCGAAVSGSVKHEVDVFRTSSLLQLLRTAGIETIDKAVSWIDGKPVTRVDAACGCSGLVINCEVGRVDTEGNRIPASMQASPAQLDPL